jgi:type I restriction enzyme S subunit
MSEWKEYKLGDLISIKYGKDHKGLNDGPYPVYGSGGVMRYADKYLYDKESILIPRKGSLNNIFYQEGPFWTVDTMFWTEIDKAKVEPKFLFYQLTLVDLENLNVGSAVPSLTVPVINDIDITLPPLDEQKRIAGVLSSLDDKIDLLHRENATLEQMTETMFRQWFVVDAKEEWKEVALGDVVKTTSGGTPSRKHSDYYENGTINWVKSKELDGTFISTTEELITEDAVANSSAKMLPEKSVLIAMYGATVGEFGILSKPMTCNQAVCALIPNKNYPYTYLYIWTALMKDEFINLASGAAQQNISQDLIKQQLVCSDTEKIMQYDKLVRGYFDKMENNQKQIQTLIQTRDELLPRLMSGEVKI